MTYVNGGFSVDGAAAGAVTLPAIATVAGIGAVVGLARKIALKGAQDAKKDSQES